MATRPLPSATKRATRRATERRFALEDILKAALRLIDRDGLDALTMRTLADELGIAAMSLYGYVRTKEEIIEGVYELSLGRLNPGLDEDAAWDQQLAVCIRELHNTLHEHPGIVELLIARSTPGQEIDRIRETLLGILRRAGFSKRDSVRAVGASVSFALGFALAERVRSGNGGLVEQFARLGSLQEEDFPYLSEVADEYDKHISNDAFEYGLAHLLAGLRNDLESQRN